MNTKTDTKPDLPEPAAKPAEVKTEKPTQPRKTDKASREKWKQERARALGDLPVEKR